MGTPFLHALPVDRQAFAMNMLYRAKTRDNCQYEVRYEKEWEEKNQLRCTLFSLA